jgi:micrococcal nuclease
MKKRNVVRKPKIIIIFFVFIIILFYLFSRKLIFLPIGKSILNRSQSFLVSTQLSGSTVELILVKRVIDGDTIELTDGRKVRYIGINSPEIVDPEHPVECFGQEAKAENSKLVEGKVVQMEKDVSETDKYGRLLRYIYVDAIFMNDYLVRQGFAYATTYPPDIRNSNLIHLAQTEARINNRGLWSSCPVKK